MTGHRTFADLVNRDREQLAEVSERRCPFDGQHDLRPTDPCPVCGDLGTLDAEVSGRCVSGKS